MASPSSTTCSAVVDDDVDVIINRMKQNAHETLESLAEFKLNIEMVTKDIIDYASANVESHRRNTQILNAWDIIRSSDDVGTIRRMKEEIERVYAEEAYFVECLTGDSLDERQKNLKRGDIPVL